MIIKVRTYDEGTENIKTEPKRIFITELGNYRFNVYEEGVSLNNTALVWTIEKAKRQKEYYIIEAYKNCLDDKEKTIEVDVFNDGVCIQDNWSK